MLERPWLKLSHLLLGYGIFTLGFSVLEVQAETMFNKQGISFDRDAIVEFEFVQSHGSYQTIFGMINRTTGEKTVIFQENKPYDDYGFEEYFPTSGRHDTGTAQDYVGTFGKTVSQGETLTSVKVSGKPDGQVVEVPFAANHQYVFFLDVYNERGDLLNQFFSTENATNIAGNLQGGKARDNYGRVITGIAFMWEDGGRLENGGSDADYDDFVVEAGGFLFDPCPDVN